MKNILVYANDDSGFSSRLAAAADLARATSGHLLLAQALPMPPITTSSVAGDLSPIGPMMKQIEAAAADERKAHEAELSRQGVAFEWDFNFGDPTDRLSDLSRLSDIIVLNSAAGGKGSRDSLGLASDVLTHVRTPILAVPPAFGRLDLTGTVVIGWNGSHESANALRASVPLLALASRIVILTVEERESEPWPAKAAATYLNRHGLTVETTSRPPAKSVADTLLGTAKELNAGYLVMGGYGHWRFTELLLGGVTRGLLKSAPLPLLLAH